MKKKPKEAFIPIEREDTVRHKIISVLAGQSLSAKEISAEVRISEKEVYGHLEHIKKSLNKSAHRLIILPSECNKCGFVFKKRDKLKKPGKCPICYSESIGDPFFSITK
ncbi:MAG TPA: transcriptional regulator [Deltaproteobacteria bacterium]|nr:MAG: transcriptional regulator [Deltaproteobacteria bacterium GWB2_42_7]OGP47905.1 MAG: transcriptional regulator [Deltaproteobacteria bacterium GWF2_42_12]OGQ69136.1 MAG: transcriptional regulator [Deltaproteobacteria bacterium RIFCSPLOWO2_12_FULL_42_16]HAG51747.1 transcriptional regulator [Deltaproteobacteria bacterium]